MVDHHQALGVVRQRQLPGHADTAVQLDAFFRHQRADPADAGLGGRQAALTRDAVGVQGRRGIDHRRTGLLDLEQQVGHAMLQRLEAADHDPELLARAQVVQRCFLGRFHRAEGFRAQGQHAAPDSALDRCKTVTRLTEQRVGTDPHAAEGQLGHAAAVHRRRAHHRHAGRIGRHQEQRNTRFVIDRARGARRHDDPLRVFGVGHHGLGAVDHPAIVVAARARRNPRQFVMRARFVVGKRGDD